MKGFFAKFKEKLAQKAPGLGKAIGGLFQKKLDASSISELEEALYEADFGVETTEEILEEIQNAYRADKELRQKDVAQIGSTILGRILDGAEGRLQAPEEKPVVICLLGVNGAGKTTTSAKLAWHFKEQGQDTLLGACDTFRAAANEQILNWAERLELDLVSSHHGADSAAVAFDSYEAAVSRGQSYLILDTAGRLHNKLNLMEELKKIRRVLAKKNPEAPHHRWLVLDGSLGTNSIEQAKAFHEGFGLTGLIITKLDGTGRGGALVGIYRELGLPIYFVGLGEEPEDLQPFASDDYIRAIFDVE
jgi:fused signal recognition particle receptor